MKRYKLYQELMQQLSYTKTTTILIIKLTRINLSAIHDQRGKGIFFPSHWMFIASSLFCETRKEMEWIKKKKKK